MTYRILALLVVAFALHLAWEMGQARWFATMNELPFWTATAWCARAAGWDVAISAIAYLAAALPARNAQWIRIRPALPLAVYIGLGEAVTIVVERTALATGRWRYTADMPVIAGIGLLPLLQWIVVPLILVAVARLIIPPSPSPR